MTKVTEYEYDLFISYNRADEAWAEQLATRIEQEEWQGRKLRVFFAPWDIRPGESIPERLEEALPKSRKVALVISPEAINSEWVKVERLVTTHIDISERQKRLIPLYRRECEIPALLKPISYIDFKDDSKFEEKYRILLTVIKDEPLPRGSRASLEPSSFLSPFVPRPPVVGFVARRDKDGRDIVAQLKEEFAPPKNQLIALWGAGGVGKTTLAAEAVRALTGAFARIVWISAEERADFTFSTLLDEIVTHLSHADLRKLALEPKKEEVRALIAAAPTLIVLDNFETITPKERMLCAEWIAKHAPCPALITTRDKLKAAHPIPIDAMSPAEAGEFLEKLVQQSHDKSAFTSIDRNRIIEAAEANPLILQWIVAQIDLAQEPHTVLEDLAKGEGDAAQRVFDRSFNLPQLGGDGRAVLLALSLFVPSASRPALANVSGFGNDMIRLNRAVKHLAALWLLGMADKGQRLIVKGLTRELARAHLSKDKRADKFRQRFVAHFLNYAKAHPRPTPKDFDALEAEKDNLLSAMDVAFEMKNWDSVMRIMTAIAFPGMLDTRGYWEEAIKRGEQAVAAAQELKDELLVAQFAGNTATIRMNRGEYDEVKRTYQQALDFFRKQGSEANISVSLHQLGIIAQHQGNLEEARQFYNESLEIAKRLDKQSGIASSLHQLGTIAQHQGNLEEARQFYNESLEIERKLGKQSGIASSLHQLGIIAQHQGNLEEAQQLYNESLEIKRKLGDQSGIAGSLHQLGMIAQHQGNLEEARQFYNESLEIARKLGDQSGIAGSLHQQGMLTEEEGDRAEAARLFREALSIFEKLKSPNAEIARRNLDRVKSKS